MPKGRVIIEKDKCKACELCVQFCPKQVLEIGSDILNVLGYHPVTAIRPEACTGCTFCALMCPDMVITVEKEQR